MPLPRMPLARMPLARLLLLAPLLALTAPAAATGVMTCSAPKASWKPQKDLLADLGRQGWKVTKAKVDGGCYEVYGTTPEGDKVEAYFDPATFDKLLVSRRGEVLYRKP